MPTEAEMLPRDKYSIFDRKVRGYRKGVHSMFLSFFLLLQKGKGMVLDDGLVLIGNCRIAKVDEG